MVEADQRVERDGGHLPEFLAQLHRGFVIVQRASDLADLLHEDPEHSVGVAARHLVACGFVELAGGFEFALAQDLGEYGLGDLAVP